MGKRQSGNPTMDNKGTRQEMTMKPTKSIRPYRIYELLGKITDGTFLNEKENRELQRYISDLEYRAKFYSESTEQEQSKQP